MTNSATQDSTQQYTTTSDSNLTGQEIRVEPKTTDNILRVTVLSDSFKEQGGRELDITFFEPKYIHKRLASVAVPQGKEEELGYSVDQVLCSLCIERVVDSRYQQQLNLPTEYIQRINWFSNKEFQFLLAVFISTFYAQRDDVNSVTSYAEQLVRDVKNEVFPITNSYFPSKRTSATFRKLTQGQMVEIDKRYSPDSDYTKDDLTMAAALMRLNDVEVIAQGSISKSVDNLNELPLIDYLVLQAFFYNLNFINQDGMTKANSLGKQLRSKLYS